MTLVGPLIEKGYFPQELPPTFTTVSLSSFVNALGIGAINNLSHVGEITRPLRHNLARPLGMRRGLSIPNPVNYLKLVEILDAAWTTELNPLLQTTTIASSRPELKAGPRALNPLDNDSAEWRAKSRSGGRYVLSADILNFYPSIYTHSIAWALHTKAVAKARRNDPTLLGNQIDKALRDGQDGQTMGIPISPDTSRVVAELILAVVERMLRQTIPSLKGHRFTDDFELVFGSLSDAESAIGAFQQVLAEFELALNPRKTKITELPDRIEDEGLAELRKWEFRAGARSQRTDILSFFDRVSELVRASRGGHTASYAIGRLRSETFLSSSWPLLEAQLLQFLVAEPYAARHVGQVISLLVARGHVLSPAAMTEATERILLRHASLGHASEIAWALWLCIANRAPITAAATAELGKVDDSIVALLALHARSLGLIQGVLQTALWESRMTSDDLKTEHWLLAYEARIKNWLPSFNTADHIAGNPFFQVLRGGGVSFYDLGAVTIAHQASAPSAEY